MSVSIPGERLERALASVGARPIPVSAAAEALSRAVEAEVIAKFKPAAPEKFTFRCAWGSFGPGGQWHHNPLLAMSAEEQWRQNVENGYCIGRPLPPA